MVNGVVVVRGAAVIRTVTGVVVCNVVVGVVICVVDDCGVVVRTVVEVC